MFKEKPASFYTGQGYLKVGRNRYRLLYNEIINLLPKPNECPPIIDLGCGVGYFAEILYKKGYRKYIGIDFSKHMIKYAKKNVPGYEYVLLDVYDDQLEEFAKKYEMFIMLETLEHITDDIGVLKKLSNSIIIGSVPNANSKGHVRTFDGIGDVFNRYKSIITHRTLHIT